MNDFYNEERQEESSPKSELDEWRQDDDARRYQEWQSDNRKPY